MGFLGASLVGLRVGSSVRRWEEKEGKLAFL